MPFSYDSLLSAQRNIDESGTELFTPNLVLYATPGCLFEIRWKVNATGTNAMGDPENVKNKLFSFRWRMYAPQGVSSNPTPGQGFRLKTGNTDTAAAAPMVFQGNGFQNDPNTNYSATLEVISATQIEIRWRCYCVSEDPGYAPIYINNLFRLLAASNQGSYMTMPIGTAFEPSASQGVSISTLVSEMPLTTPPSPAYLQVGTKDLFAPIVLYWHGRKAANAGYQWILSEFTNTTGGGQVIASKTHKSTVVPWDRAYDNNFVVNSASLSPIEDNNLYFKFSISDGSSADMDNVRAIVMRVNDIDNSTQFLADYQASIGNIPASDTGMGQISGAIHAPASVVNSGSSQCEVRFRIPPGHIVTGARYRILIVLYSDGTQRPYSGVTHELTADDHPEIYPNADIFTADYFQESVLPRGLMGYHSAYQSRIEIQKSSISNAFAYYGLTGSFDLSVRHVLARVLRPGTENALTLTPEASSPEKFLWLNGSGMLQGQSFTDGATLFEGSFLDFIDEKWLPRAGATDALYYISVEWEVGILSAMPNGNPVLLKCRYHQKIDARRWESEAGQPTPPDFNLTMTLYRLDEATLIPDGTQFICGQDEVLALVEKSEDIAGIDAYCIPETYGETTSDGNTTDQNIRQRHGTLMGILPVSTNTEINAYDALFSLNAVMGSTIDDAGIRVDIRDLGSNQKFWLVALARKVWPNGIPFIADDVTVDLVRDGGDITTITADFTSWWLSLVADTGVVSPYNFRIVNSVTQNFAGITDGAFNNPSSDDTQIEVTVDHNIYPQLLQIDLIYEIEGTIVVTGDNHLVRFMVRKTFDLPTSAGTINDTIVTADWKSVDFDF
jgi:hypothetical protein